MIAVLLLRRAVQLISNTKNDLFSYMSFNLACEGGVCAGVRVEESDLLAIAYTVG